MTVALADAPQEPQSLRQPTGLRLSTLIRASHQPGEKRAAFRSNSSVELLNFMKKSASRPSPFVLCTDHVYGRAIPQGFRRTFVRGRSVMANVRQSRFTLRTGNFSTYKPPPTIRPKFEIYCDV